MPAQGDDAYVMLFLDEIQFVPDWQTWLKHQVDFQGDLRIAATGSASPLREAGESGVGRWETIPLPTLSFAEFLRLQKMEVPGIPEMKSLRGLFNWTPAASSLCPASRGAFARFS